jgi:REP-associated tyrosine transposase
MPRTARASVGGVCYHVLNRGNGRGEVFHKDGDYAAFLRLIGEACERVPMSVFGYCLMPNHFHLVVRPRSDGDLSRWMQWLMTSHVRRYHRHYHGSGHVWQGRFKAFPIQADEHLLTVLGYVERNPVRAKLVRRGKASDWAWSSLRWWGRRGRPAWLAEGPVKRPRGWARRVNLAADDRVHKAMGVCIERGRPYGGERWTKRVASELGIESSLRPLGRPRVEP